MNNQKIWNKNLKKLKVFGYAWHVGHQFELAKLFKEYHFLTTPYRVWGEKSRPFPENAKWVTCFDPKEKYDLVILHVDQTSIDPRSTKHILFKEIEQSTRGVPRVVINHMTPKHDRYSEPEAIKMMKDLVKDIPMVCNSTVAQKQWGWGTTITHGLDPDDWYSDLPKEPRITIVLSAGGMDLAYQRVLGYKTVDMLEERGIKTYWVGKNMPTLENFEKYREWLGRSAIFFFPAKDSPFPRARTEAMMSGCCIVTTPYHDADKYIEHGVNGFLVKNPFDATNILEDLVINRYKEAVEIGQRGRQTAIEKLHIKRWADDWEQFLIDSKIL